MEEESQKKLSLMNQNLVSLLGKHAPLAPDSKSYNRKPPSAKV